ncbi:hypothetical protein ABZ958_37235 [Streptomyces sp. NPDC046237]|uniref:hypothetical protein n=1 Tax=Streptomyces sp. NPDC046237 TaxID=3154914 RepID=UPI0033EEF42F
MSPLQMLSDLIGAQALRDHLTAVVQDLVDREHLDRADAYQRTTDAADAGDPAVLAATRQMWLRRDDVDPAQAPARRLYVLERTHTGVFVAYIDIDQEADDTDNGEYANVVPELLPYNDHSAGAELPVEVLEMYRLETWEPFEHLLPTAGVLGNVRPITERNE